MATGVTLTQQRDQSWSHVCIITLNQCFATFSVKTRGWCACSQSSGRSINHPIKHHWFSSLAHGSCRSSHLTIFLMVLACHIALTNSVYLQEHHTTLCTYCQLAGFWTKSAPFPKISAAGHLRHERIRSYAGSCRLGAEPIHRTATGSQTGMSNMGFQWLESRATLKPAGVEHTSHVLCWA